MPLQHHKVSISIVAQISERLVASKIPVGLEALVSDVADLAMVYESKHALGYYPALDYLANNEAFPDELFRLFENSCQIISYMVSSLILNKLKAAFSQVYLISIHHLAYNMPPVRRRDSKARDQLAIHYMPNRLHIELELSQIQKMPMSSEYEVFARRLVYRWLSDSFEHFEITASHFEEG